MSRQVVFDEEKLGKRLASLLRFAFWMGVVVGIHGALIVYTLIMIFTR